MDKSEARLRKTIIKFYAFYPPLASMQEVKKVKKRYLKDHGYDFDALEETVDSALLAAREIPPKATKTRMWITELPDNIIPFAKPARRRQPKKQSRPNRVLRVLRTQRG